MFRAVVISQQQRRIRNFYKEAYEETRGLVETYDRYGLESSSVERMRLRALTEELRNRYISIDVKVEKEVKSNINSQLERVVVNNRDFLTNGLGFYNYRTNTSLVVNMADMIVTGKLYSGKWSLSEAIWGNNQRRLNEINAIVAKGVLQGKSSYEIAKQLQLYVNPSVRTPVMAGVAGEIDYNAQRLARTMVQHAYQEAFVEMTKDNPFVEAYRWITSGAGNVCEVCTERESTDQYGLGEGVFPKDALPLDHPNGNCTFEIVTTWTEESAHQAVMDWLFGEGDPEMNRKLDKFSETF